MINNNANTTTDAITTTTTTAHDDNNNTEKKKNDDENNNNDDDHDEISSEVALLITTKQQQQQVEEEEEPLTYVNQGFLKWEEERNLWIEMNDTTNNIENTVAKPLDVDEIIDQIFSQRWRSLSLEKSQFPQTVPLPQMVDILVDLWEAEGLDI